MKAEIAGNPDFGHVTVQLGAGERVLVESGAMSWMSSDLEVNSRMMGGFFSAFIRKIFAGESLFVGEYTASQPSELAVSPSLPGEVRHMQMQGQTYLLQPGSFMACSPNVSLNTQFGGLRGLFSGEGLFFLKVGGSGDLWLNAYGAIIEHEVDGEFIVDTGHLVGWEPQLDWKITGMGSFFSTFFSGEGLVMRFSGKGKVLLQTRNLSAMAGWLSGYCRG